jgi:hypothetical protein
LIVGLRLILDSPIALLFPIRQGTGVNYEDRVIRVKHINHLQESATTAPAYSEELIFSDLSSKRVRD